MTCEGCQPNRGWWHKLWQKCGKCGGWPKPADERMALVQSGGGYVALETAERVALMVTAAAREAFHPELGSGEPSKLEVVRTCAALVAFLKLAERDQERTSRTWREAIENLVIKLGS